MSWEQYDAFTIAGSALLIGMACGWVLCWLYRELLEWGRAYARLLRDIRRAVVTGRWT